MTNNTNDFKSGNSSQIMDANLRSRKIHHPKLNTSSENGKHENVGIGVSTYSLPLHHSGVLRRYKVSRRSMCKLSKWAFVLLVLVGGFSMIGIQHKGKERLTGLFVSTGVEGNRSVEEQKNETPFENFKFFQPDVEFDCDLTTSDCIREVVNGHPVVLFTNSSSPQFAYAVSALLVAGAHNALLVDLVNHTDSINEERKALLEVVGNDEKEAVLDSITFVGGKSLGGGMELFRMQRHGELRPVIERATSDLQPEPTLTRNEDLPCRRIDLLSCMRLIVQAFPVFMTSIPNCPQCVKMKNLLASLGVSQANGNLRILDMETDTKHFPILMEFVQQNVEEMSGGKRTVPILFVGGKSIGGFGNTNKLHLHGKLVEKFREVGALSSAE